MLASFSSRCNAIGTVLGFQGGTPFVERGIAASNAEMEELGEEMLEVRSTFYCSLGFTLLNTAVYLSLDGGNLDQTCANVIVCASPVLLAALGAFMLGRVRDASYLYHRAVVELHPEMAGQRSFSERALLQITEFIHSFCPRFTEYLGCQPIELQNRATLRGIGAQLGLASLVGQGISQLRSSWYAGCQFRLSNCAPTLAGLSSLVAIGKTVQLVLGIAERVEQFLQHHDD